MTILLYDSTGKLVVSNDHKRYEYRGVSPHLYHRIKYLASKGWYGRIWGILRRLERIIQ